ncbi:anaerobic sulfatase maturase [Syntrophorhabdus aromaticivorans]|uniref:anaerobic sulfatase maturase n=1 Tax=Syntrophorhabdus aromaticivorans TaxID=328301 RepID=UPI0004103C00|nr:anaerobic sulfatase maturase [Syntrophorhabdus aromaticivorans]
MSNTANSPQGLHIVAKPNGPACNLACDYCFYTEKQALFPEKTNCRMTDKVLRAYISKYIAAQPTPEVEFVWQGGEPTLLGLSFFKKALEMQKPFAGRKIIKNTLQTNGTLLTDEWCAFLKGNNFLVGISLDGPREIHDRYRKDRGGRETFGRVIRGLRLLQKHGVEYNVMACVARETAGRPLEVYRFFKGEGVEFIQFFPIVERVQDERAEEIGFRLGTPPVPGLDEADSKVTPWSVEPEPYGDFLIAVFDEWVRNDVGKIFVMNFEWMLNAWMGYASPVCVFAKQCGRSIVMEHDGDVYACDHYVYPEYRLGNILDGNPLKMISGSITVGFGAAKETALPGWCRECDVLVLCWGGCPKHRFTKTFGDEPGLNYLCPGYKKFFNYSKKHLRVFRQLLEHNLPASKVMDAVKGPLVIKLNRRLSTKTKK